jgi:hypothetical protein
MFDAKFPVITPENLNTLLSLDYSHGCSSFLIPSLQGRPQDFKGIVARNRTEDGKNQDEYSRLEKPTLNSIFI